MFLVCCIVFLMLAAVTGAEGKVRNPADSVTIQKDVGDDKLIDVDDLKENTRTAVNVIQVIGIDVCLFVFILGWIIIALATGLKHPQYMKWGRASLITSSLAFFFIKIGPILAYNL